MKPRILRDRLAERSMRVLCAGILSLTFLVALGLFLRARPIFIGRSPAALFFSSAWRPTQGEFGVAGFIVGSLWVTGLAMLLAVPFGVLTAIYLAEYAPTRVREFSRPITDMLAGISPVVYGVWGVVAVVPVVRDWLMPLVSEHIRIPIFTSDNYTGFTAMTAGIVLAVMVLPVLISIMVEVFRAVPFELREASLALGATRWETVKWVVLRRSRPGIVAAMILALSRAFGETMAVLMVAGCTLQGIPHSIFDAAYPLPALIANTYGEMMSVPLYDAAVLMVALTLFVVTVGFNMVAWGILIRLEREGHAG